MISLANPAEAVKRQFIGLNRLVNSGDVSPDLDSSIETGDGSIMIHGTMARRGTIMLEVFNRSERDYAAMDVNKSTLLALIAQLQKVAAAFPDNELSH